MKSVIIAGPCLMQGNDDIILARRLKEIGVDIFRAKPYRGTGTHPSDNPKYYFREWQEIMRKISCFMEIATEYNEDVKLEYFDWIWIPCRRMQDYDMLQDINNEEDEIGGQVILKRGFGNTIDEVVGAIEYLPDLRDQGRLWVCERGIDSFDRQLDIRWRPDFLGMLELKQQGYKVIFDPSHACGKREFVLPMAKAALELGVDGLMIECRENPDESWSDKNQCISLNELEKFIKEIKNGSNIL